MKKFFKWFFIVILILILAFTFIFRGKLSLYINVGKKYIEVLKNPPDISDSNSIKKLDSMDFKDVVYKESNGSKQTLDIYSAKKQLPNGSPVILYVHGGSWMYGDKSIPSVLSPLLDTFREQGFTVISTSYELMRNNVNFEKQVSDVKDTIRWIHENANKYNLNADEIGVIGTSAGAHLSLLAAYSDDSNFQGDLTLSKNSSKVKYIVDFFGPTNLNTLDYSKGSKEMLNVLNHIKDKDSLINKYSPINYVKEDLPKTLIIHSKKDTIVPYENSIELYNKLKSTNNKVELLSLENSGHDLSNINKNEVVSLASKILIFITNNSPL
ncbi:alpha/beta hydrolase [Clostridium fallax]|uniref:Triacylglycerol lipase n=1 Tax=Clostridium fallax TaxID=1533 RepID=A0A1M4XGZ5_9CLOT|nr:alpha/beta hydrolase [Clostridium fallax]SHE92947.1 triacylglycerol lipase [Clostridium fallax]SQB06390.1 lipase [Clostridium fallax]